MNNIKEARELTLNYLEPLVAKHGFSVKVSASKQVKIERKGASGTDILAFDLLDYKPVFQIRYAFQKINTPINDLLIRLQQRINLRVKEDKKSWFLFFSYNTLHKPTDTVYLPFMETEPDVQNCIIMMTSFIEETGIPLLVRFDDLREVDRIINGDDPWETDWHKPYVFGSNFHLKRLVIAKLAGLDNYEKTFELLSRFFTSRFNDKYGNDFKVAMAEVEELNNMLKEVKPLN
ncbi:MAG TPA: hypothetical protein VD794_09505 [Flavisolibacter sp.]|nr:hypothetical protein [Flavisolibacter sp.]